MRAWFEYGVGMALEERCSYCGRVRHQCIIPIVLSSQLKMMPDAERGLRHLEGVVDRGSDILASKQCILLREELCGRLGT